jgi:arsenite methyltransferase
MSEQADGLRELVRERYAAAATLAATGAPPSCCDSTGQAVEVGEGFGADLYAETERGELPAKALATSLGCGNPLAVAELRNGGDRSRPGFRWWDRRAALRSPGRAHRQGLRIGYDP